MIRINSNAYLILFSLTLFIFIQNAFCKKRDKDLANITKDTFDKSFLYFFTLTLLQQTVEGLFSNLFLFRLQASVYDIYMTLTALK